jgi:hypothetical protein
VCADSGRLQRRAVTKLTEIEHKIADLQVIATSLRTALDAGCDDLTACATAECCPLPFADLDRGDQLGVALIMFAPRH